MTEPQSLGIQASSLSSYQDLFHAVALVGLTPLSLLGERHRQLVATGLGRVAGNFVPHGTGLSAPFPTKVVQIAGLTQLQMREDSYGRYALECMEVLRTNVTGAPDVKLRLVGAQRLRGALKTGRGVVLWRENGFSGSLLSKVALGADGFSSHQLSRTSHGFSNTQLGMRILNPLYARAETLFLEERIVFKPGGEVAALRQLRNVLLSNGIVSITVGDVGAQVSEVPLFDGILRLATGAPHLALSTGAALFPIFCFREPEAYVVEVGEQLRASTGDRNAQLASIAHAYADQLAIYIAAHPLDWSGWRNGTYRE